MLPKPGNLLVNLHCRIQIRDAKYQQRTGLSSHFLRKHNNSLEITHPFPSEDTALEEIILILGISSPGCTCSHFGTDCSFFSWATDEVVNWLVFKSGAVWKICIFKHSTLSRVDTLPGEMQANLLPTEEEWFHDSHALLFCWWVKTLWPKAI